VRSVDLAVPVSDRDHVRGPEEAPVTVVEYGDYQCSDCATTHPTLADLRKQFGTSVRVAFRHFPMAHNPCAERAAQAAEAAGAQGRFWAMHDRLYEHQDALDEAALRSHAQAVGLELARFDREMDVDAYAERVRADVASGRRSGVTHPPALFVNGEPYDGSLDREVLADTVRANL
jgi:protein-disulfide isomerase